METKTGNVPLEAFAPVTQVRIYNQIYNIRPSDGNIERAQKLALMVDQRMREISNGLLTADSLRVAILAALHMADELDKISTRYEELNRNLAVRSADCAELLDQVLKK